MTARWERQLHRLREAPVALQRVRERAQQPPRAGSPLPPTRERVVAGVVAVAVFVAVAAIGWRAFTTAGDETAPVDAPPALPASPISLWLSAERVPPGPVELVALLVNHDGSDGVFGVWATVDRWDGREWVPYSELVMCMDHWHCTARVKPSGDIESVPALGLSAEPGRPGPVERFTTQGLDVGWYRISQEANEGIVAAAVFEIAEGAPGPGPLVSIDAPAISVTPALVSPDGGEIDLYPLIPAPTGAQSREDVLEAIRGLSEVARIERWNGSTWEAGGEIQLREADDDLARFAELPPLPEGEYRLVREGPEGQHIGHFWVDETIGTTPGAGPGHDLDAPPPVTVRVPGRTLELNAWTYCFGNVCADGLPPEEPPDVGSPEEVAVEFPLPGWSFTASFVPADMKCGQEQHVRLEETAEGRFLLEPAGYAGDYNVTLFGQGDGDLFVSFRWTTPRDGPLPSPTARLAILADHDGQVDSYGVELEVVNLATTPEETTASITVRAASGDAVTFDATPAELRCLPRGTLYWDGPDEQGLAAAALGDGPFTYEVELFLDGVRYLATASWPRDLIAGNEPSVALHFTPDLPALD